MTSVDRAGPGGAGRASSTSMGLTAAQVEERVADGRTNAVELHASRTVVEIVRANVVTFFNGLRFVLFLVISAILSKALAPNGLALGLAPFLVGFLVWGIGMSLGGPTGYAINPARDLGPRLTHTLLPIAGKRDSDWGYAWVPIVGPIVGAALAATVIKLFG